MEREDGAARRGIKEPVDFRISLVALLGAAAGMVILTVRFHAEPALLPAMLVYGASLVVLFGASSAYHGLRAGPRATSVLRTLDHASIYAMIAGTYTPLLFIGLGGAWRTATLAAVWFVAAAGIALTVWFVRAPRWLSAATYAAMGWLALVPAVQLVHTLPEATTILIGVGGLLYTIGAVVYATKALNFVPGRFGFHEVFHLFVVAGATTHFVGIAFFVSPQ
jgi:hemolysin III